MEALDRCAIFTPERIAVEKVDGTLVAERCAKVFFADHQMSSFEKNVDNVRQAAKDMRIDYAVAIDSDYAIWHAFKNEYWPALYFADAQGRIRHHVSSRVASCCRTRGHVK